MMTEEARSPRHRVENLVPRLSSDLRREERRGRRELWTFLKPDTTCSTPPSLERQ